MKQTFRNMIILLDKQVLLKIKEQYYQDDFSNLSVVFKRKDQPENYQQYVFLSAICN